MTDPNAIPGLNVPLAGLAEARARLVKLLGRMLAEEWLARQRSFEKPPPRPERGA